MFDCRLPIEIWLMELLFNFGSSIKNRKLAIGNVFNYD